MVYKQCLDQVPLASVLAAAAAAAAVAAAAVAAATVAAASIASVTAVVAAAVTATAHLFFHRHLRPLHRRSECPKLHSLAQLSVELRQQRGVLHHADCARHWSAPDSDLL